MINIHRVKKQNADKVMSALAQKNINAEIVPAPINQTTYYETDGWYGSEIDKEIIERNLKNMTGIKCDMSGNKFHKLLVEIGVVEK